MDATKAWPWLVGARGSCDGPRAAGTQALDNVILKEVASGNF